MSKVEVFGCGMLLGLALGILFAPRKGSETRAQLKRKCTYLMGEMSDFAAHIEEKASESAAQRSKSH